MGLFGKAFFGGGNPEVDVNTALKMIEDGATLLDVREPNEWRQIHAKSAVPLPLGQVSPNNAQLKKLDKEKPVVVICASGMRSQVGAQKLRDMGFDATSLRGGMSAWLRNNAPVA